MDEDTAVTFANMVLKAFHEIVIATETPMEPPKILLAKKVRRPRAEVVMTEFSDLQKDCYGLLDDTIVIDLECEREVEGDNYDCAIEAQTAAGDYFGRSWLSRIGSLDLIRFRQGERFPFSLMTAGDMAMEIQKEKQYVPQGTTLARECIFRGCWAPQYPASKFIGGYVVGIIGQDPKIPDQAKTARKEFRDTIRSSDATTDFEKLIYIPFILGAYAALTRKAEGFKALIQTKPENLAMCLNHFYREVVEV